MDTYYEGQKVERYMRHTLNFLYAKTILELLNEVVVENCYGCEVSHASQVQHICLMWTEAEHLDIYFDQVFNKIQYQDIVKKLREHVKIMDISIDHKNKVLEKFEEWCNEHKP